MALHSIVVLALIAVLIQSFCYLDKRFTRVGCMPDPSGSHVQNGRDDWQLLVRIVRGSYGRMSTREFHPTSHFCTPQVSSHPTSHYIMTFAPHDGIACPDGLKDGRMLPNVLSPCYVADK